MRSPFTYLLYAVTERMNLVGSFFNHILPIARAVLRAGKLLIEQGKAENTKRETQS